MSDVPRILTWNAVSTKAQDKEDKFSINYQLDLNRAMANRLNGVIVDELIVPGFSRDYWTLADVVAATDDTETDAFRKLWRHIQACDFDYFVCFEADRFGRTPSLVHEVIGRITRDVGASIITTFDNMEMNERNATMIGSIKAIQARQGVEKLVEWRRQGMDKRARDGRSSSSTMALFHVRLRDDKGKDYAVGVNEALRSLWTDLATAILRRVSWEEMEQVLFNEFHHGKNGAPYRRGYFRDVVMNSRFWGHASTRLRKKHDRRPRLYGPWRWDKAASPPKGVTVYYDTLPAVYAGPYAELGERVREELWRRYWLEGSASPQGTFRFHGLVVCADCGYTMTKAFDHRTNRIYLNCTTRWRKDTKRSCSGPNSIRADVLQSYLGYHIQRRLDGLETEVFNPLNSGRLAERRLKDEQQHLAKNEARLRALIVELQDAPDAIKAYIRQQMGKVSEDIERGRETIAALETDVHARRTASRSQENGFTQLREHGVEWLWQQEDGTIHQILVSILGDAQIVIKDHQPVGIIPSRNKALLTARRRN